jgi:D-alanyl-D-alanine carboxypeptidase/D-alanyl-D-alanine-endopeptidase (penicillin-binding protein 4)
VGGTVPLGRTVIRTAAVRRPVIYATRMLWSALERRGIAVRDGVAAIRDLPSSAWPADEGIRTWVTHRSPPLRELAVTMMKQSSNQYAETLLATLGAAPGQAATVQRGRQAVSEQLAQWQLPADGLVLSDGSGLTRYDYVTAELLTSILERMYRDPRHREAWLATFPVAGVDGTLAERFKGSAASGVVRAKTGSIANVRALSGYVPASGGEWLAFSIVVNNVTATGSDVTAPVDAVVNRLVSFRR